jgi:hypothetical protein
MHPGDLIEAFPKLYHIAEPEAWDNIRHHGLLSTTAILDLFDVGGERRSQLLTRRRSTTVRLEDPELGSFAIRDQIPLSESKLAECLTDMTVGVWLRLLNRKVFFWLAFGTV